MYIVDIHASDKQGDYLQTGEMYISNMHTGDMHTNDMHTGDICTVDNLSFKQLSDVWMCPVNSQPWKIQTRGNRFSADKAHRLPTGQGWERSTQEERSKLHGRTLTNITNTNIVLISIHSLLTAAVVYQIHENKMMQKFAHHIRLSSICHGENTIACYWWKQQNFIFTPSKLFWVKSKFCDYIVRSILW